VPNPSSTGKSRGYTCSLPWHTVAKPEVTVSPPWTQIMPVCYSFARWSYCGDTVHAGRAMVMPRKKPVLFRSPVRPGKSWRFKKIWNHRGHIRLTPVQHGVSRFNAVSAGVHFNRHFTHTTTTEIIFLERIWNTRQIQKNTVNVVISPDYKCQGRIAIYRAGPRYVSWAAVSILYRYIAISSHPYYWILTWNCTIMVIRLSDRNDRQSVGH